MEYDDSIPQGISNDLNWANVDSKISIYIYFYSHISPNRYLLLQFVYSLYSSNLGGHGLTLKSSLVQTRLWSIDLVWT